MARDGSGGYSAPTNSWNPAVNGASATTADWQSLLNDLVAAMAQSVSKDGQTTMTGALPMGSNKITGLASGTSATDAVAMSQLQNSSAINLSSVSGTNTITASLTNPTLTAYTSGQIFTFIASNTITGATTININSLGAKSITKFGTTALAANDILSGQAVEIIYDGTQFQLQGCTVVNTANTFSSANTFNGAVTATSTIDLSGAVLQGANPLVFEGSTADAFETTFAITDPTADRTITFKDGSGTVAFTSDITGGVTVATSQASTSGTSISFTGIPSTAKEIVVSFVGVSTSGTDSVLVRLGTSSGAETSGYLGSANAVSYTNGFSDGYTSASAIRHGTFIISLVDSTTNTWACSSNVGRSDVAPTNSPGGFSKSLSATLDRVVITTTGGTDTFDAGVIGLSYKT